jgi:hypothetical protein
VSPHRHTPAYFLCPVRSVGTMAMRLTTKQFVLTSGDSGFDPQADLDSLFFVDFPTDIIFILFSFFFSLILYLLSPRWCNLRFVVVIVVWRSIFALSLSIGPA